MNAKKAINYTLLTFTSLIWAGSFIAVGITVNDVDPIILAAFRFIIATPIMIILLWIREKELLLP